MATTPIPLAFAATTTSQSSTAPVVQASFTPPLVAGQQVTITLTVIDSAGNASAPSTQVVKVVAPPIARFTSPPSVIAGQPIKLDASGATGAARFNWTAVVGPATT